MRKMLCFVITSIAIKMTMSAIAIVRRFVPSVRVKLNGVAFPPLFFTGSDTQCQIVMNGT